MRKFKNHVKAGILHPKSMFTKGPTGRPSDAQTAGTSTPADRRVDGASPENEPRLCLLAGFAGGAPKGRDFFDTPGPR